MIVAIDNTIDPYEAVFAAAAPVYPWRTAHCVTASGTRMEPAQRPTIETVNNSELTIVRRLYCGVKSVANASRILGRWRPSMLFFCHVAGSRTPLWIHPTRSAGVPPRTNIQRQP